MKLIDTSAWIQHLRRAGKSEVRARVALLLDAGAGAWCAPVRLELWAGVGRDDEAKILRQLEVILPDYRVTDLVWLEAQSLAERGRRQGLTAPAMDVVVAACARHYQLELEHDDTDFEWLMRV